MVKSKDRLVKGSDGLYSIVPGNGRPRASWEELAMTLAQAATCRSEDPYVQVGACCLRHDHSVAGVGFNGAPPDIEIDWSDREKRKNKMVHAEINCLNYVKPGEANIIAVTIAPCEKCLVAIAAKKIKNVVYGNLDKYESSLELAEELGMTMTKLII